MTNVFIFYFFYIYNITLLAQRPNFNIRHARISIYVYLSIFLKKKKKKFIYQFVEYFIDEYECVGIDNRIFTWKKKEKKNRISAILLISLAKFTELTYKDF